MKRRKVIKASTSGFTTDEMYDMLVEFNIATEDEIALVTSIVGDNTEAYENILYSRTGDWDFASLIPDYE